MKKYGFGKKPADGDDANRSALFGKKRSPAPSNDNPYAQPQTANDPYAGDNNKYAHMTPYQQARAGLPSGPGPRSGYGAPPLSRNDSHSSSATAPPAYPNGQAPGGYANDKYGTTSGYGSSKYSNSNNYGSAPSLGASRPGGYGGLGRTNSDDTDVNRDALLSGARERHNQGRANQQDEAYGVSGANSDTSKYGGYGEQRELTEEEKDHEAAREIMKQADAITDQSVDTAHNSEKVAVQSLDLAMGIYTRLGAQNERLHNAEEKFDTATNTTRDSTAGTKKLKSLNRSMFAVHFNNPFTEKRRTAEEEARILEQNRSDRAMREASRKDKFAQNARMESNFRDLSRDQVPSTFSRRNRGDQSKFAFEYDSDEERKKAREEKTETIDDVTERTLVVARKLHNVSEAIGEEIDHSIKVIDRVGAKAEPLEDEINMNKHRLEKIIK